jgi:GT2 family glycosyltransferase
MTNPILSVSVVLYNTPTSHINKFLHSLYKFSSRLLLFIVDNSPSDILRREFPIGVNLHYIHLPANPGYGSGHNVAILMAQESGCIYHLVMNADVSFETDILSIMLDYMELNPDVGQIMPKVLNPDGTIQPLCKLVPTPFDLFFRRFAPKKVKNLVNQRFELHHSRYDKIIFVPYLSGCFMLLRHSALKKIGLFDEQFFMYPEDIDLTRRMAEIYKTIFFPTVSVVHEHTAASRKSIKMLLIHIWNLFKYFNKWGWFYDPSRKKLNKITLNQFN